MFKSQLQEYAQKAGLAAPVYDIKKEGPSHEPQFKASVTFQGQVFESPTLYRNLRKAEHAAAEVALASLGAATSDPLHESGLCKNLLQEYAQKCKLPLPLYTTLKTGETNLPLFISTVEIAGVQYKGGNCRTKKEAEIKAARTALVAIYADSGPVSLGAGAHSGSASAPVEPTPAEPNSGVKRKKFWGGNTERKQKVKEERSEIVDEDGNGDVLQAEEFGGGNIVGSQKVEEKESGGGNIGGIQKVEQSEMGNEAGNGDGLQVEAASEKSDDIKQANESSSLPTDSADKGPEQMLLDLAAAENPDISPELSVQAPRKTELD